MICCKDCDLAFAEPWGLRSEKMALRCGNAANESRTGWVVGTFPAGRRELAPGIPAPAWCARWEEEGGPPCAAMVRKQ